MPEDRPSLDALRIDRDPEPAETHRRWPLWLAVILILVALIAGAVAWRLHDAPPRVVTRAVVAIGDGAPAVLDASGYVTARLQATVSSEVTGKIEEILVEEGMEIEEGQVLARLDDTAVRAGLRLAEANLRAARGALRETEVRLEKARIDLRRAEALVGERVSAQADLDAARAEVDALRARLDLAGQQVEVARREVAAREVALDDTVIRAPFDGVAVSKDAQPGEMISPVSAGGGFTRTGICTLVDMGSLEIEVDVGESYIQRVRAGQVVEATLDAYPDWRIPARVITIVPAADRDKATVRVRIGFEELDPRILPEMGVHVAFLDREGATEARAAEPRLLVPREAVVSSADGEALWTVESGRLRLRPVIVGAREGDRIRVLDGVSAGDRVVVDAEGGLEELVDGTEVRVVDAIGGP